MRPADWALLAATLAVAAAVVTAMLVQAA